MPAEKLKVSHGRIRNRGKTITEGPVDDDTLVASLQDAGIDKIMMEMRGKDEKGEGFTAKAEVTPQRIRLIEDDAERVKKEAVNPAGAMFQGKRKEK